MMQHVAISKFLSWKIILHVPDFCHGYIFLKENIYSPGTEYFWNISCLPLKKSYLLGAFNASLYFNGFEKHYKINITIWKEKHSYFVILKKSLISRCLHHFITKHFFRMYLFLLNLYVVIVDRTALKIESFCRALRGLNFNLYGPK